MKKLILLALVSILAGNVFADDYQDFLQGVQEREMERQQLLQQQQANMNNSWRY